MEDFGDFQEVKEESKVEDSKKKIGPPQVPQTFRLRSPRQGQFIGVVTQRLGGNRMSVKTTDGKTRNCRVPGRFRRRFWLRPGDAIIIEPWPDDDSKGDIVFQYRKGERFQLKKRGLLDNIDEGF